ncbi:hypothetical protein [Macrococcus equi]|uniref:hypothetical protein n=1 Tax=Macrococcus equi TaxID=3395462 RepID=UPI0039BDE059
MYNISKWKNGIFLLMAIIITMTAQDISYVFESLMRPIYTLTTLNVFAFLLLIVAIVMSVNNIIKSNSEIYTVYSMFIIALSLLTAPVIYFITAMWWG